MHVLHILLAGKWDPINLLDDEDLWISSQGFITSTSHAVAAAEAINQILEFDPGLEFMPFFFGIYLLQGSFLLLLIADKLQSEASPSVAKACETIVRAHEACVVTLSTEYQVSPSLEIEVSAQILIMDSENSAKLCAALLLRFEVVYLRIWESSSNGEGSFWRFIDGQRTEQDWPCEQGSGQDNGKQAIGIGKRGQRIRGGVLGHSLSGG
jgi:hypothetical protein